MSGVVDVLDMFESLVNLKDVKLAAMTPFKMPCLRVLLI